MPEHEVALAGVPLRRIPSQARSRDKVARSLAAADLILDRDGVEALNLTRVAAEAGVSVGALYQYLPDREAIVEALAARYHARLEALMDDIVAEASQTWPEDPIGSAIDAFTELYRGEAGVRALRIGQQRSGEAPRADDHKRRMAAKVCDLLAARGVLSGEDDSEAVGRVIFLAADAVMHEAFRDDADGATGLLGQLKTMLRCYLSGLESGRPPAD